MDICQYLKDEGRLVAVRLDLVNLIDGLYFDGGVGLEKICTLLGIDEDYLWKILVELVEDVIKDYRSIYERWIELKIYFSTRGIK